MTKLNTIDVIKHSAYEVKHNGYVKRCTSDTFKQQHRGGVGVKGMSTNEEDYVKFLTNGYSHDYVLFFTILYFMFYHLSIIL